MGSGPFVVQRRADATSAAVGGAAGRATGGRDRRWGMTPAEFDRQVAPGAEGAPGPSPYPGPVQMKAASDRERDCARFEDGDRELAPDDQGAAEPAPERQAELGPEAHEVTARDRTLSSNLSQVAMLFMNLCDEYRDIASRPTPDFSALDVKWGQMDVDLTNLQGTLEGIHAVERAPGSAKERHYARLNRDVQEVVAAARSSLLRADGSLNTALRQNGSAVRAADVHLHQRHIREAVERLATLKVVP